MKNKVLFICLNNGKYYLGSEKDFEFFGCDAPERIDPAAAEIRDGKIHDVVRDSDENVVIDEWVTIKVLR